MAYDDAAIFYEALEKSSCVPTMENTAFCRTQVQEQLATQVALDYGATGRLRFDSGNRVVSESKEERSNGDGILVELREGSFERIVE
ncbi:hypothetical protein [Adonisia turfae]|uniref:Uncharacterized protein n=1 Tax=Adonisia turfae CCMR0081 TaxID=2292702 RepID=A0A6M0RXY1_9CYAN|nr:hypothetical protein [Adonisia turfae]NEZ60770.1 hypothetical protein [Adonisia turfae CCMR0081]